MYRAQGINLSDEQFTQMANMMSPEMVKQSMNMAKENPELLKQSMEKMKGGNQQAASPSSQEESKGEAQPTVNAAPQAP
jgi:hypothetical protein